MRHVYRITTDKGVATLTIDGKVTSIITVQGTHHRNGDRRAAAFTLQWARELGHKIERLPNG